MEDFIKKLTLAIISGYRNKNLDIREKDARDISEYLLSFFGYNDEIIDNVLFRYDRDVFYSMEDIGIVDTRSYAEKLENGKVWTLSTWTLKRDNIEKLVTTYEERKLEQRNPEDFYSEIFRKASMNELKNGNMLDKADADFAYNYREDEDNANPVAYTSADVKEYLSIFTTMLSPSTKPLMYMAIDYGREYSTRMIGEALAKSLGIESSEIKKHMNIQSTMDSMVSIGALARKRITKEGKEITLYSKVPAHCAFELVSSYGIMVMSKRLIPMGLTLNDLFSVSVAQIQRTAQARNVFELVRLLSENPEREFRLLEVKTAINSYSVKHCVAALSEKGILDYDSYPSSGGKFKVLGYTVVRSTSIEELADKGFVKRPGTSHSLSKAIGFINANVGNEVNRHDISENCGTDKDLSSKYLVLLSRAGVLERRVEWNHKRSGIKANEKTLAVWEGTLSWLYRIAETAARHGNETRGAAIASAIKEDGDYEGIRRYIASPQLQNDMKRIFEAYGNGKQKTINNLGIEDAVLDATRKKGAKIYEIMKSLKEKKYDVSYAGTQWYVNKMLRKGFLKKEGKVYTPDT